MVILGDEHLLNHIFLCNCLRLHGHLPVTSGNNLLRYEAKRPQCSDDAETDHPDRTADCLTAIDNLIHFL